MGLQMVLNGAQREINDSPEQRHSNGGGRAAADMAVSHQVGGGEIHKLRGASSSTLPEGMGHFQLTGLTMDDHRASGHAGGVEGGHARGRSDQQRSFDRHRHGPDNQESPQNNLGQAGQAESKPVQFRSEVRQPGEKPGDYTDIKTTTNGKQIVDTHRATKDGGYAETHTEEGQKNIRVFDKDGKQTYGKDYDPHQPGAYNEFLITSDGRRVERVQRANGNWSEVVRKGATVANTEHENKKGGGFKETSYGTSPYPVTVHDEDAKGNYKESVIKDGKTTTLDHTVKKGGSFTERTTDSEGHVTTREHTAKSGGDYTETITDANGKATTEHTSGPNGAFHEVTTGLDGTKKTHDQKSDGSFSELTEKGKEFVSLKTREVKEGGGYIEKTKSAEGDFVHEQSPNGDYIEKSFDKDSKLKTPPVEVKGASPEFAQKVKDDINNLPAAERKLLADTDYKIVLTDTLVHANPSLAGQTPPGHMPGEKWDELDGVHNSASKKVTIAERTSLGSSTRSDGTLRHETGHAVDFALGQRTGSSPFSDSKEFDEAYQRDFKNLTPADKDYHKFGYLLQLDENGKPTTGGKKEAFAEIYGALRGASSNPSETKATLEHFPNLKELIRQKLTELESNR
jgi:hypothetical protein